MLFCAPAATSLQARAWSSQKVLVLSDECENPVLCHLPALLASCRFKGAYDIRKAVDAARQQRVLHPLVLGAVATTLAAAARLQQQLEQQQSGVPPQEQQLAALRQLAAGIGDALPQLRQAIEQCLQVSTCFARCA